MKKIPTLFVRVFNNHRVVDITPEVTPGLEWVLAGEGKATVKIDGSCCLIKNGELYRRYDAKAGRKPPEGAIPCCDPDPITGHWPHWVKCSESNPDDRWYLTAYKNTPDTFDGTFEAIGSHFQKNPYRLDTDILVPHGQEVIDVSRTF